MPSATNAFVWGNPPQPHTACPGSSDSHHCVTKQGLKQQSPCLPGHPCRHSTIYQIGNKHLKMSPSIALAVVQQNEAHRVYLKVIVTSLRVAYILHRSPRFVHIPWLRNGVSLHNLYSFHIDSVSPKYKMALQKYIQIRLKTPHYYYANTIQYYTFTNIHQRLIL